MEFPHHASGTLGTLHCCAAGIGSQVFVDIFLLSRSKLFCPFTRLVYGDFPDDEDFEARNFICRALVFLSCPACAVSSPSSVLGRHSNSIPHLKIFNYEKNTSIVPVQLLCYIHGSFLFSFLLCPFFFPYLAC